jgi:transposase
MNKSTFFSGQPVFTQLIKFLPKGIVQKVAMAHNADYYCKKFDTHHHLITMLYACYQHCTSLREVSTGMRACEGRLQSLGIKYYPARSTFSEANRRRSYKVFEDIYQGLYAHFVKSLPDSHIKENGKDLVIIDSTSISLFKEILESGGSRCRNGKKKGGIKVHMAVKAHEDVPFFVDMTKGSQADVSFLKTLKVPPLSIVLMDRGYNNYKKFAQWGSQNIHWVTRRRKDAQIEVINASEVTGEQKQLGILSDNLVMMGSKKSKTVQLPCRVVNYFDAERQHAFEFVTNNTQWPAIKVAELYKKRWQIEILFKRLKQNMPLQYFLGDNENAIKIQIYAALIADLLLKIALQGVRRKWAFSNLSCLVRLHLMNYTDLLRFLENPEKAKAYNPVPLNESTQLNLYT